MAAQLRFTIVAAEKNPVSGSSQYGHPRREVVFWSPVNGNAVIPLMPTPKDLSGRVENPTGNDFYYPRLQKVQLRCEIDHVNDSDVEELHRLKHDGAEVYFTPNFGRYTIWSLPLFRSFKALVGPDFPYTRSLNIYVWDDVDKCFHKFGNDKTPAAFHGHYLRYVRASNNAFTNDAAKPHPDSTTTGWTVGAGTATVNYDDNRPSFVLAQRGTANSQGVTVVDMDAGGTVDLDHAASGLSSGADICASVVVQARGGVQARLLKADSTLSASLIVDTTEPQLIKLVGAQSAGGTTATLQLRFIQATTEDCGAIIGPVCIGNPNTGVSTDPPVPDWVDGTGEVASVSSGNLGFRHAGADLTVAAIMQKQTWAQGILTLGASPNELQIYKRELNAASHGDKIQVEHASGTTRTVDTLGSYGIQSGDWYSLVCVFTSSEVKIFVNGVNRANWSGSDVQLGSSTDFKTIGLVGSSRRLDGAGMCLLRVDQQSWSDEECKAWHKTYYGDRGKVMVSGAMGRRFTIEGLSLVPAEGSDGSGRARYIGEIDLREVYLDEDLAVFARQENG